MKPLKLEEIVRAIDGRIVRQGKAEKITGISTDTRTIKAGDLFIPLIGENFNGHKFIEDAVSKGAAAILTQELNIGLPVGTHIVYTNDTLNALQTLSSWYLKIFNPDIIAVNWVHWKNNLQGHDIPGPITKISGLKDPRKFQ